MSSLWVVLDTSSGTEARRIGQVQDPDDLAASAPELTVHWPDGQIERVKLSPRYRKFRLDTLSAMAEFAPEQLANELTSSPLPFARALAERPKVHLRAKEILALVVERGKIEKAAVDRAWKEQRKAFELLEQVHVEETGSGAKYNLLLPLPVVNLDLQVHEKPAPEQSRTEDSDAGAASDSAPVEWLDDRLLTESSGGGGDAGGGKGEATGAIAIDIVEALSRRNPPTLDDETLDAWFASDGPGHAIAEGATVLERLRTQPDLYIERLTGFSLLVSRILKRADASIPAETLARAFVALRRSDVEADRRRGLEALERLAGELTKPTDFLSKIDRTAFQAALADLPFIEGSPRVRFLVMLGKSGGSILEDSGWWRGFGWPDVLAISTSPLSALIDASESLMAMIRKVVDEYARDVTTRRGLSALLGGPRFALEHIAPTQMRSIFERVEKSDEMLARWADELTARAEREDLSRRVADAEALARQARQAERQAREDLNALAGQLADVQGQFSALQEVTAGLSTRERRQVLIDAAKVVAQVAATVEGDGRALDHEALTRKVTVLAERFGLHIDARPGDSVAFDPSRHSAPGARPDEGEIVNVARAGYTWDNGEERVVVLPSLVTRVSGSEESA